MADVGDAKFPRHLWNTVRKQLLSKKGVLLVRVQSFPPNKEVIVIVYITGDTHADFKRFSSKSLSVRVTEYEKLTKDDYMIICGDFGGIWSYGASSSEEEYWLKWLDNKPFTILFVDGNHENYDRLKEFPRVNYHGGVAHKIRNNTLNSTR